MFRQRPGPTHAVGGIERPLRLALRLHNGQMWAWSLVALLLGAAFGMVGVEIGAVAASSQSVLDMMSGFGPVNVQDAYFTMAGLIIAFVSTGLAIAVVTSPNREESAGVADLILSRPLGRSRWLTAYVLTSAGFAAIAATAGGLGLGLAHAIRTADFTVVLPLTANVVFHLPAIATIIGIVTVLYGWKPGFLWVVWIVFSASVVITLMGSTMGLPSWAMQLSLFEHTPRMLVVDETATGVLVLVASSLVLTIAGVSAFRRRDIELSR